MKERCGESRNNHGEAGASSKKDFSLIISSFRA